ncbi:MAG: response regulator transcription factor [Rubrivivax sp.]|jgi:DNA-binding NarL/FixJ family response regulator|nr:response regulator transcription factor [Rubrivivax sp.]
MKVLLVDDHPLILSALQAVIQGLGDNVSVTGASSAQAAREAIAATPDFDMILLDLSLGDADGFDLLAELRAAHPEVPVVVVSASERASDVIRAIDLGAMGFVPKRTSNQALFEALRMVMQGGLYVPPTMLGLDYARLSREGGLADAEPVLGHDLRPEPHQQVSTIEKIGLTPRQTEVLGLLLKGLPNKLIARELDLSVETVKDHVAAVLRALGVSTRTQAVLAVSQMTQGRAGIVPTRLSPNA